VTTGAVSVGWTGAVSVGSTGAVSVGSGRTARGRGTLVAWLVSAALLSTLGGSATAGSGAPPLRVGASGDYSPFSRLETPPGAESGAYVGFDAEVARRFAADLQRPVAWVPFRWPDLVEGLRRGDFDVGMSGITVRPERSIAGRFSVPVAENGAVLLVRAGAVPNAHDVEAALAVLDARDTRIAVNRGGHLERVTRSHFARAEILAIPDNAGVREALAAGRVDAAVTDTLEVRAWREGRPEWSVVGPFTRDRKAYLLQAGDAELAARLDAWLLERERDGTLGELRERYFGAGSAPRTAEPVNALLAASDERLALMPFVADFKRRAGREVVDADREERVLAAARAGVSRAAAALGLAAPAPAVVDAFYRAQIDAAVAIQQAVLAEASAGGREAFDLERELRPALLRIGERMAQLLVRAGTRSAPADLEDRARASLARHRLPDAALSAIVASIRQLEAGGARTAQPPGGATPR